MKHASLFSGIGGFDLAAEWAGWENIFHCEINTFCQKVLKYHFPKSICYDNIKTTDFRLWRGKVDILTGGFPCQPFSLAGKRKGTEDDRHLWPEMLRAIREIQPRWIVGENVFGLVNWDGGLVFEQVQADLENEGYEVQPFILPACAVNAPHRRDRVWFVAHASNVRRTGQKADYGKCNRKRESDTFIQFSQFWNVANTDSGRQSSKEYGQTQSERIAKNGLPGDWSNFPTQSPICGRNDGLPNKLDGITFPKWRNESIKAYGNAIVPQVAFEIFKAINQYESL